MDDCSKLNWSKLQVNLSRFGQSYDEDLQRLLVLMLERDIRVRPDWLDLNRFVQKNTDQSVVDNASKRDHFITRTVRSFKSQHKPTKDSHNNVSRQKPS